MQEPITSFSGAHSFLSNFASCKVEISGIVFPTVEHAFQASKTLSQNERQHIALLMTPGKAKRAGRLLTLRDDWESVKVGAMLGLLKQKFHQEPFRSQLLATGERKLIEGNTWGDTFWGVCQGEGKNMLGTLLMQIRSELQLHQKD